MIPKYRAFLKAEKKMYPVATLYLSAFAQQVELAGKGFTAAFTIGEEVELMQATGLTDKHGKDIWQGDIVRDGDDLYCIRWARHLAQFALYWHDNEAPKGSNKEWRYEDSLSYVPTLEVIGNIYETPNLLQEKD